MVVVVVFVVDVVVVVVAGVVVGLGLLVAVVLDIAATEVVHSAEIDYEIPVGEVGYLDADVCLVIEYSLCQTFYEYSPNYLFQFCSYRLKASYVSASKLLFRSLEMRNTEILTVCSHRLKETYWFSLALGEISCV